jgi:AcrR family transcriptional regulator
MPTLTIADLVAETGVPRATIHSYLRLGLLPRPKRLSPVRFAYDERHVRALRLIRSLRERRQVSLSTIGRVLPELLQLEPTEAFLPVMWDRALAPHPSVRKRQPDARLLEAAKDAFARRGYGEVNVDELCRAARIAKGSFYRHYRSKEELFLAVADSSAQEVAESFRFALASDDPPERALARVMEARLPIFLDLFGRSLQRKAGYGPALRRLLSGLAARIGEMTDPGAPDPGGRGLAVLGGAVALVLAEQGRISEPAPQASLTLKPGRSHNRIQLARPGSHR